MDFQELNVVASLDKQVTGVAITDSERVFLSMPTFVDKENYNVGELIDGEAKPYKLPKMVCVTSVHTEEDVLYVVDQEQIISVDTKTDKVLKVYKPTLASGSKLNDIRIADRTAFISEYGNGSLIVLDLDSGKSRQLLLKSDKSKAPKTSVKIYDNEIRGKINLDGIELSPDKKTFYFCFPLGGNLWSVSVKDLLDIKLTAIILDSRIKKESTLPAVGGIVTLSENSFLISNAEKCSIDIVKNGEIQPYIKPSRILQWPDALTLFKDHVYFACSQLDSSPLLNPGQENEMKSPFNIFRIPKP